MAKQISRLVFVYFKDAQIVNAETVEFREGDGHEIISRRLAKLQDEGNDAVKVILSDGVVWDLMLPMSDAKREKDAFRLFINL